MNSKEDFDKYIQETLRKNETKVDTALEKALLLGKIIALYLAFDFYEKDLTLAHFLTHFSKELEDELREHEDLS